MTKRKAAATKKAAKKKKVAKRIPRAPRERLAPMTAAEAGITCHCGQPAEYYLAIQGYVCGAHNKFKNAVKLALSRPAEAQRQPAA
jgi:hypothetical protein